VQACLDGSADTSSFERFKSHLCECESCLQLVLMLAPAPPPAAGPQTLVATEPAGGAVPAVDLPAGAAVGRYRTLYRIGEGGMGVVYAAHDPELDRNIAVKVLRSERARDPAALRARLQREAQALARLSHPNVITIYDVGTAAGGVFIAMELVDGGTLGQWLRRDHPWRVILEQFARAGRGLEAAHKAGLVHRDFKPENVLVGNDGSVRVTDFGLARRLRELDGESASGGESLLGLSMTGTGMLLGTPAYMAPEQMSGGTIDARTDIFSFCVALYEALYRQRPFVGQDLVELRAAVAAGRIRPPPKSDVPRRVHRALLVGLRAAPAERYATMRELLDALAKAARTARSRRRLAVATVLTAASLLGGTAAVQRLRHRTIVATRAGRPAVAVLGLSNRSNHDADWLATALTEALASSLAEGERVRVVAPDQVARVQRELGIPDAAAVTAAREALRRGLAADFVVTGAFTDEHRRVRLEPLLIDLQQGDTRVLAATAADEAELDALVDRAGMAIRQQLGVPPLGANEPQAARAFPSRPEAMRAYAEALERLRALDPRSARDRLERAIVVEPDNPLLRAALAQAWHDLGFMQKSQHEAERAFALSSPLPREMRLGIEAQYRTAARQWPRAIEIARALWTFYPDNLDYGVQLAETEWAAGQPKEALLTVAELRKLPVANGDPRVSLAEANAAMGPDPARARDAALRAAAEGRARHAPSITGNALHRAAIAELARQDLVAAIAHEREAQRLFEDAHDAAGLALAANQLGILTAEQGRLSEARALFEQAIAAARSIGNERYLIDFETNMGIVLLRQLDLRGARRLYEDGIQGARAVGEESQVGGQLNNLANVLHAMGELDAGVTAAEEALAIFDKLGNRRRAGASHAILADLFVERDRLADARQHADQSLRLHDGHHFALTVPDVQLAQGRLHEAEASLRQIESDAARQKDIDLEAEAASKLAWTLLATSRTDEARHAGARAQALLSRMQNRRDRLIAGIVLDEVVGRSGDAAERAAARRDLQAVVAETTAAQLISTELRARLALGRLDLADHQLANGREQLRALANDAARHGFLWIAHEARRALASS
jgi:TolB-like protein